MLKFIVVPLKSLLANKMRFFLSILWIIVWITSVTVMLWIWEWVKKSMLENLTAFKNVIIINQYDNSNYSWWMWWEWEKWWKQPPKKFVKKNEIFNKESVLKLQKTITNIKSIVPKSYVNVSNMKYAWKEMYSSIYATTTDYFIENELEIDLWYIFTKKDEENKEMFAVVWNWVVKDTLMKNSKKNPIWQKIDMWWKTIVITWILKESKTNWESNYWIFIPMSTAQERFWVKKYESFYIYLKDVAFIEQTKKDVWFYLTKIAWVEIPSDAWFAIQNDKWWMDDVKKSMMQMQLFLWWISGISLFVWGIWIMNIMLVSVTERTREIWIRKALWAKRKNILFQFLSESMIISIVWCLLAFVLSFVISYFLNRLKIQGIEVYLSYFIFLLSSWISILIWILFWIMPAWKASRLNPITALRFE